MNIGTCFWVIMIIWLIFGLLIWNSVITWASAPTVSNLLLWVLFALLGWKTFGPMLRS